VKWRLTTPAPGDWNRALRFAFGVTLSTAIVYAAALPLGFLSSVLVASLLGTPAPRPGLRALGGIVLSIAGAFALGIAVSLVALGSPLVYYLAMSLLLYWIFHANAAGAPAFPMLMLLLGVVLVPVLGLTAVELGVLFAEYFLLAATLSLPIVWGAHWVFPDRESAAAPPQAATPGNSRAECHQLAARRTLALLPLLGLVVSLQQTGQLSMLLYAAILIQAPGAVGGRQAGRAMIGGSLVGGAAAIGITLVTQFYFSYPLMLGLVLLASLLLGTVIFGGGPNAALAAKAPAAMLILLDKGSSLFGDPAADALLARVISLGAATLYVAAVIGLHERLASSRAGAPTAGEAEPA
jgi:hypothetical protein